MHPSVSTPCAVAPLCPSPSASAPRLALQLGSQLHLHLLLVQLTPPIRQSRSQELSTDPAPTRSVMNATSTTSALTLPTTPLCLGQRLVFATASSHLAEYTVASAEPVVQFIIVHKGSGRGRGSEFNNGGGGEGGRRQRLSREGGWEFVDVRQNCHSTTRPRRSVVRLPDGWAGGHARWTVTRVKSADGLMSRSVIRHADEPGEQRRCGGG
ncbi:hypothetical protein R3P38DRAFT_3361093 [Favolaschia claudopus]|uniref:Uncharacterized protein n=1 Tax=Favolaschia claudopus TaxID=2862362 RepID=A0AAW0AW42_9AGAR